MNQQKPLVTIFFLGYNCGPYLEKAVTPLLNQTYQNIQFIFSDNQSTDNTETVAKELQKKYPQIIYRKNIPGITGADITSKGGGKKFDACFNHCNGCINSGMAKGEFIMFCHQDDIYKKDIIEKEVDFLLANHKAAAVFSLGSMIDKAGNILGYQKFPGELKRLGKNSYQFAEIFRAIMRNGNSFFLPSTCLFRADIFNKVGLFDDQGPFGGSDDLEMWLRILETAPVGILQENLIDRSMGGRSKKYNTLRTEEADFFKVMDFYLDTKGLRTNMDKKSLRQYAYQKDFDNTLRAMNFVIQGQASEAKKIIGPACSPILFYAFFEQMTFMRTKVLLLKYVLIFSLFFGLENPLGKALKKLA